MDCLRAVSFYAQEETRVLMDTRVKYYAKDYLFRSPSVELHHDPCIKFNVGVIEPVYEMQAGSKPRIKAADEHVRIGKLSNM